VIDNAATFHQLLGTNLAQLSFEERQAIAQCLISKIVVTGEDVDVHFLLPFDAPPQVSPRLQRESEGAPGHFYRLRLADFHPPAHPHGTLAPMKGFLQLGAICDDPPVNRGVIHLYPTFLHEFFDMARAQRVRHIPADPHQNNLWGEMGPFEIDRHRRSPS
jgi:hypothetical protein